MVDGGLEGKLRVIVATELGLATQHLHDDLSVDDLGLDSLAFIQLIVAIEEQLESDIDMDRLPRSLAPNLTFDEVLALLVHALPGVA